VLAAAQVRPRRVRGSVCDQAASIP
jgi:hypothetical protein